MQALVASLLVFSLTLWPAPLPTPNEEGRPSGRSELAPTEGFAIETRSGQRVEGRLLDGEGSGLKLAVAGPDGVAERVLPAEDCALIWNLARLPQPDGSKAVGRQAQGAPGSTDAMDLLLLVGAEGRAGDRLWGRLLGGDDFGLRMRLDDGLEVEVPFDAVDRLLPGVDRPLDRLLDLAGGGFDDRLWRRRTDGGLDGVTGVLARLEDRAVILESALGELRFPVDNVLALVLSATEHPDKPLEGWPMTVRLVGGSLFEATLHEVAGGVFHFETQFSEALLVPQEVVASLLPGGRGAAIPLDRYEPVEVEEWPALGGPESLLYPWRRGLSVSGQPLRVGGLLRTTGLGVHANARLRYEVPAGVTALRVTVGLVDEVFELPAEASVTFEILVDGTSRASTGVFREGDAPRDLRVDDLESGQILELVTLDAGDLDAGDRAAWVDGLFFTDS